MALSSEDEPLIYTTLGNIPVSGLDYSTYWEITDDTIKFTEVYKQDEEIVKSSSHIYFLKPTPDLNLFQGEF